MDNHVVGLILSYALVGLLLLISTILSYFKVPDEINRKSIHIGISFWWFIAMAYFDDVWIALIPPFTFLIANLLSRHYGLIKVMQRKNKYDFGTIYYPLSMIILTWYSFGVYNIPELGAIGIFIMGFGDAFAAIFGKAWGNLRIYCKKTCFGSITMFITSFIVCLLILSQSQPHSVIVPSIILAVVATLLETYSPWGTDNLTVPLVTTLIYYYMFFA